MALVTKFNLNTRQLNTVNAFTNNDLNKEIYVDWPFSFKNASNSYLYLLLLKAFYGLRHSPLLWFRNLSSAFVRLGLRPIPKEAYTFRNDWLIAFFFVDDIALLFRRRDTAYANAFIANIKGLYEMKDLGEL